MTGKGNAARLAAAILAAALGLSGCQGDGGLPVNNEQTAPATSSATAAQTTAPPDSAAPADTEEPAPVQPPEWKFPLAAAGLFGGQKVPEGFLFPLHLWEDGSQFLFATGDGRVLRAGWNGSAYTIEPVAEGLATGGPAPVYVDGARQWLFAAGPGKAEQSIVMVDLSTTERCDLCDLAGWSAEGLAPSQEFQVAGGIVLARLQEQKKGSTAILDRWLMIDPAKKSCSTLDLSGFAARHLSQWEKAEGVRLALLGSDRLLAVWTVRGGISTGQAAVAFVLDSTGAVVRELGAVRGGDPAGLPSIAGGTGFAPSPDGRLVLFDGGTGGVCLYDVEKNEQQVLGEGPGRLAFAQWDGDGGLLYGLGTGKNATVHRLAAPGGFGASPQATQSPQPSPSPAE